MPELSELEKEILREHFGDGEAYERAKEEFLSGTPLAYVISEWYFYGMTFRLNRDCLIPRPDTECVVETVIALAPRGGRMVDLCTGSGCIAIAVKKHRPDIAVSGCDISPSALGTAKENAVLNGTDVEFYEGDVFSLALPDDSYDVIVSNPPYIPSDVVPTLDTVQAEPVRALDGGKDGLKFYARMIGAFLPALRRGGAFVFEIGYDQRKSICALAEAHGLECRVTKDYGGNDRVAVLRRCAEVGEKQ